MKQTNGGEKREADDEGEGRARAYINTAASTAEINFSFVSLRGREASFGSSYPEAIQRRSLAAKHFHRLTVRVWVLRAAAACLPPSRDRNIRFFLNFIRIFVHQNQRWVNFQRFVIWHIVLNEWNFSREFSAFHPALPLLKFIIKKNQ